MLENTMQLCFRYGEKPEWELELKKSIALTVVWPTHRPPPFLCRPERFSVRCARQLLENFKCRYAVVYVCTTKITGGKTFGKLAIGLFKERYFLHLLSTAWKPNETVRKNIPIWHYAWRFCIISTKTGVKGNWLLSRMVIAFLYDSTRVQLHHSKYFSIHKPWPF